MSIKTPSGTEQADQRGAGCTGRQQCRDGGADNLPMTSCCQGRTYAERRSERAAFERQTDPYEKEWCQQVAEPIESRVGQPR